jgi:hypothetical protein
LKYYQKALYNHKPYGTLFAGGCQVFDLFDLLFILVALIFLLTTANFVTIDKLSHYPVPEFEEGVYTKITG